jgi:aminoglycoside 2''-phosphotransferase
MMDERWVAAVVGGIAGPVVDLAFLGEGHFTAAWLVDGSVVYRFAKHADAALSLRREACLLPRLAPHLPLKIPQPRYYDVPVDPPAAVGAHVLIEGEPLTRQQYDALDRQSQDRCAAQIAAFLRVLHQTDRHVAQQCGVDVRDYRSHYLEVATRFEQHMAPRLSDEQDRGYIRSLFEAFFLADAAELKSSALLHGDLSASHILWDPRDAKIAAIIDFGDMIIADPAGDLVGLYEDYGMQFMRDFMRYFPTPDREALLRHVYRLYELSFVEWAVDVFEEQRLERVPLVRTELSHLRRDAPHQVWRLILSP